MRQADLTGRARPKWLHPTLPMHRQTATQEGAASRAERQQQAIRYMEFFYGRCIPADAKVKKDPSTGLPRWVWWHSYYGGGGKLEIPHWDYNQEAVAVETADV